MPDFKTILSALVQEGFQQVTDKTERTGKEFDYNITPYSLNTKLSFRFDDLEQFVEFLPEYGAEVDDNLKMLLLTQLHELDLKQDSFFYVNFFEKGKDSEM